MNHLLRLINGISDYDLGTLQEAILKEIDRRREIAATPDAAEPEGVGQFADPPRGEPQSLVKQPVAGRAPPVPLRRAA
ncbi:MAG: hypothetical protein ABSF26_29360 [Thermoguttaceae bacterium]|jgi:hypothetical protein